VGDPVVQRIEPRDSKFQRQISEPFGLNKQGDSYSFDCISSRCIIPVPCDSRLCSKKIK
jgi:hypothetical protein